MQCLLIVTLCVEILVGLFAKFIDQDECKKFTCSFEKGDFCNYESKIYRISDQRIISKLKIFTSQNRALKNPRSISKNVNKYAAAVLSSQQVAVLETNQNSNARLLRHRSPKFRKSDARVIKFRYFTTSPDSNIFVCCNDVSNCLYSMPRMRQPVFYRWHRSSFECKEKLEKV
uniref:Uncharacterized protein n=1 Tax=Romanomermis culicivorax TaxID=13658 RepID=A0A915HLA3_ROMCU